MPKLNAQNSKCHLYTFFDGFSLGTKTNKLFSFGYDLKFQVMHFEILSAHKGRSIKAQFDASKIKVLNACKGGVEKAGLISTENKQKINQRMATEVLESHRFRRIYFEGKAKMSSANQGVVEGDLTIHGTSAQIRGQIVCEKDKMKVVISLDQKRFDIEPYSAFLGLLRVKPIVKIVLEMPLNALS